MIRALCHLLEPDDCGLTLLTSFVLDWAQNGPVARNHLQERLHCFRQLHWDYERFFKKLNQPDFYATLQELEGARHWLKEHWPPYGVDWRIGPRCQKRLEQAQLNSGPDRNQYVAFTFQTWSFWQAARACSQAYAN